MTKIKKYFNFIERFLLICGILSALLYVSTDIILAMRWEGYSYINQSISELSAIGAPTRPLWITMTFLFNPLLIAFGIGVWKVADQKRTLQLTGILLSIWGLLGFVWLLFPMHLRGAIGSATDTMHLVMAGVTVLLMTLFIGVGSGARGKWFRLYSILSLSARIPSVLFGFFTSINQVACHLPIK
jgi:Protein of unknown function (DUF998)